MLRAKLNELFGIDPRSLAVLRVGLALMLLADTYVRFTEIDAMYADTGLMSIASSKETLSGTWTWSLNYLNGSHEYQGLLLGLTVVSATLLLLGWNTWWATLISWVLLSSVHVRTPLTPNGGDILMRLMLFWSLFVPLGRVWSLDAWLRHCAPNWERVVSPGTAALMIQLTLVYLFTAFFKSNEDWFAGRALYYAYSLDWSARPWGTYLLEFPELLKWLTWATLGLEWGMAVLVWSPWQTHRLRMLAVIAFVTLHVVIHFTMMVGLFSAISIVAWSVFLPREFWESRPLTWLASKLAFATRPSATEAVPVVGPSGLWLMTGRVAQGFCLAMIFYVIAINAVPFFVADVSTLPRTALRLGEATNMLQRWDMFGKVTRNDGWFVARARLRDGSVVDVLRRGEPYTDAKPALASSILPTQHWRYYFHLISQASFRQYRQPVAEYLYRNWNASHGDSQQILLLELIYFHEDAENHPAPGEFACERWARVQPEEETDSGGFDDVLSALKSGQDYIP